MQDWAIFWIFKNGVVMFTFFNPSQIVLNSVCSKILLLLSNIKIWIGKQTMYAWSIRQDSTLWSLRQMLKLVRGEKLLAVVHFIFFLRILQKLYKILHPSRQVKQLTWRHDWSECRLWLEEPWMLNCNHDIMKKL